LGKFVEENGNRQNSMKIISTARIRREFLPLINLFKRISLEYNVLNNFQANLLPEKFDTTELLIDSGVLLFGDLNSFDILFPKFKKLKYLKVHFSNSFEIRCLKMLLDNNPIVTFELFVYHSFTQLTGLIEIIGARRFKSLKLGFYPRTLYQEEVEHF